MILFVVRRPKPWVASARYRAYLPALYMRRAGEATEITSGRLTKLQLERADAVVFVKAFSDLDLRSCILAHRLHRPIFIDLCDHIFVPDYGAGRETQVFARNFMAMAAMASAVTSSTEALAEEIRPYVPAAIPVHTIPDMVETQADVAEILKQESAPPRPTPARTTVLQRMRHAIGMNPRPITNKLNHGIGEPIPDDLPRIIWFGNHGFEHSTAGMLSLLSIAPTLIEAAKQVPFRLVVVSNNHEKFKDHIAPLPIPTSYREWTPLGIYDELKKAKLCLLPNPRDSFSLPKSNNRAILALANGVPVIASDFPAMAPLKPFVICDSWLGGILTYLRDPVRAQRDVRAAQDFIYREYSGATIAKHWLNLRDQVRPKSFKTTGRAVRAGIWVHIEQVFDIERVLRSIQILKMQDGNVLLTVRTGLITESPQDVARLENAGLEPRYLHIHDLRGESGRSLLKWRTILVLSDSDGLLAQEISQLAEAHGLTIIKSGASLSATVPSHLRSLAAIFQNEQSDATYRAVSV